ncbi:sigmaY antisigma factor component [Paenibacillus sp. MBLB4367]|uniref:sigmaY antisigma factor component n=1 Tax=Paenibacillus sp. MBLB4367 TaxID=3384767 RepID=UPI00390818F5
MTNPQLTGSTIYILIGVCVILLLQGSWLFLDSRKRGASPWLWGLWGLIQCPMPLIVYWLVVRKPFRRPRGGSDV